MSYVLVVCVAAFWFFVLFIDNIFRSCMLPPYLNLLGSGLQVKPGYIQFYTSNWNRSLQKWGWKKRRLQLRWYDAGAVTTCLMLPISVLLLCKAVKQMHAVDDEMDGSGQSEQIMQPVIPGVNIPLQELPYYLFALLLCSVLHEMGHALAAAVEDVKVQGFGLFLMGIFPGAFVDLPTDQITLLSPWQQLRIFAAGVWHNVVIVMISLALLFSTPYMVSPFYTLGKGITVLSVQSGSGVDGETGLQPGNEISNLNDCQVLDLNTWNKCLENLAKLPQRGYCVNKHFINDHNDEISINAPDCCGNINASHICFKHSLNTIEMRYCLHARKVLYSSHRMCDNQNECEPLHMCLKPILSSNGSRWAAIHREKTKPVIFIGPPLELYKAVSLSNFISRHWVITTRLVNAWETFLKYMIAFSGALAILNVVPCFYLDGTYIIRAILDLILSNVISVSFRRKLGTAITCIGSVLLLIVLLSGLFSLTKS